MTKTRLADTISSIDGCYQATNLFVESASSMQTDTLEGNSYHILVRIGTMGMVTLFLDPEAARALIGGLQTEVAKYDAEVVAAMIAYVGDPIGDSDLDDEQPIGLTVRERAVSRTLGDIRRAQRTGSPVVAPVEVDWEEAY